MTVSCREVLMDKGLETIEILKTWNYFREYLPN